MRPWVRRHRNGVSALVIKIEDKWHATATGGAFLVFRETLEQARADADELVAKLLPHDCVHCAPWGHGDAGAADNSGGGR